MPESVLRCPGCGAPLTPPSRFARTVTCGFCAAVVQLDPSVVHVARYREARAAWDADDDPRCSLLAGRRWIIGERIGRGDFSDVFHGRRSRGAASGYSAAEHVLFKVLRSEGDLPAFDREWHALTALAASAAPGAPAYTRRIPQPVTRGVIEQGPWAGKQVLVLLPTPSFRYTLQQVRAKGAPDLARASIWVWRRMLEILTFLHGAGVVHGAVLPPHVLIQDGEHGARLLGFGNAGVPGSRILSVSLDFEACYPSETLSVANDVTMSARTVLWLLGDPKQPPRGLPAEYARTLVDAASGAFPEAWALREHLGAVANRAFGAPTFCPLA